MLDHGIVVRGPLINKWDPKRHCVEPGHVMCAVASDQTDLTCDTMSMHEMEFLTMAEKLQWLQDHVKEEHREWKLKLDEVQQGLILKVNWKKT